MDGKLLSEPSTYTEQFYKVLPYYLSIGMTAQEFWEGDCTLPIFFRKANKDKQEAQFEMLNYFAWLSGRYTAEAVASVLGKNHRYPAEPFGSAEKAEQKRRQALTKEEIMEEQAESFRAYVKAFNEKIRKKKRLEQAQAELKSKQIGG